jgi:hypothetical protein
LIPVSALQLELRSDHTLLEVNELSRSYPETAAAIGEDYP